MHSLLEIYLAEVAAQLRPLPAKRREEEIREMRQHLLDAVKVNREQGQSEEEAAASALAEFGSVEEASRSIRWAWDRDTRKASAKAFGLGAATWTAFYFYEGVTSYPNGTGIWLRGWVVAMLICGLAFGIGNIVQRLPLAGETPLQAPAWLRKRLRRKPIGIVSSD